MPTLKTEQIKTLALSLNNQFEKVYLRCDGYLVAAGLERMTNKLKIFVYVNGSFKGEWVKLVSSPSELPEEARRFYFHSTRSVETPKRLKKMEKVFGKRWCKKNGRYNKRIFSGPVFNSPMPFIRHIMRYNESIEVIDYADYRSELDDMKDESNA